MRMGFLGERRREGGSGEGEGQRGGGRGGGERGGGGSGDGGEGRGWAGGSNVIGARATFGPNPEEQFHWPRLGEMVCNTA